MSDTARVKALHARLMNVLNFRPPVHAGENHE